MEIRKETVRLQYILESVCEDMIGKQDNIITLKDKIEFVKENLKYAHIKGSSITLKVGKRVTKDVREMPFFNYLLVYSTFNRKECDDGSIIFKDRVWKIRGFNSFYKLKEYAKPTRSIGVFYVYVRCANSYSKALLSFSYQTPGENRNYVDQYGFYIMNFARMGFYRHPQSKYFFEICGLCEIYREDEIYCCIINSYEALDLEIENIAFKIDEVCLKKGIKLYSEEGTVSYNNNIYTYRIKIDDEGLYSELRNKRGELYCTHGYCFCVFDSLCQKGAICDCDTSLT